MNYPEAEENKGSYPESSQPLDPHYQLAEFATPGLPYQDVKKRQNKVTIRIHPASKGSLLAGEKGSY